MGLRDRSLRTLVDSPLRSTQIAETTLYQHTIQLLFLILSKPRLLWFDCPHHPEALEGRRAQLNGVSKGGEHPLWSRAGFKPRSRIQLIESGVICPNLLVENLDAFDELSPMVRPDEFKNLSEDLVFSSRQGMAQGLRIVSSDRPSKGAICLQPS